MSQNQFTPMRGEPAQPSLEDRWNEVRAAVRKQWPELSKEDLNEIDGDSRKLIALVHQKTGADISEIESHIDTIAASSEGLLARVTRTVQSGASAALHRVSEPVGQAYQSVHHQLSEAPGRASLVAFATGLVIGLCTASVLKDVAPPAKSNRWW